MILPSKHIPQQRALLSVGARILQKLDRPATVSALWEELPRRSRKNSGQAIHLSYDSFILALDLLFLVGAIDLQEGLLSRKKS